MSALFDLNPALNPAALAEVYRPAQRLQVRDVLTDASAKAVHAMLRDDTPWGLAWKGAGAPARLRREEIARLSPNRQQAMTAELTTTMQGRDYGFLYSSYPMVTAYLEQWRPGSAQDALLEAINAGPFLELVSAITGVRDLVKADAQATLYAPNQFLAQHDDAEAERGRRVAYVLSLCAEDWRSDWGGYLNFLDADGDVIAGYRPRFNALNLFTVPQPHNVTMVPWFAPAAARFAITGWFRDR